jgi:hypothetical protein
LNLGWRDLVSAPKVTKRAEGLVAGAFGVGRAHDDMVNQFNFQKLASAY